jgi:hypothetical protein
MARVEGRQTMKQLGSKEMKAPEKKPYNSANTTNPARVVTPSQPNNRTAVENEKGMIILNGPVLSATKLGNTRPKIDAALRIESCRNIKMKKIIEFPEKLVAPNKMRDFLQCPATGRIL